MAARPYPAGVFSAEPGGGRARGTAQRRRLDYFIWASSAIPTVSCSTRFLPAACGDRQHASREAQVDLGRVERRVAFTVQQVRPRQALILCSGVLGRYGDRLAFGQLILCPGDTLGVLAGPGWLCREYFVLAADGPPVLVDSGKAAGVTTEESKEVRDLKQKVRELEDTIEILKAAAGFFARQCDPRLC